MNKITISVVSHGQGKMIKNLFEDLNGINLKNIIIEIILTLNIQEEDFLINFPNLSVTTIRNKKPKGFGENHNYAFQKASGDIFIVINPDIRLDGFDFSIIAKDFIKEPKMAVWAPAIVDATGVIQDSARAYPTLDVFFKRFFFPSVRNDYEKIKHEISVDWVAGMFMAFDSRVFEIINGFDIKYFMYLEDADICRRLTKLGYIINYNPVYSVTHNAQRDSRKKLKYFLWHLRSVLRFLFF